MAADNVLWTRDREGGDWNAAGECFELDHPKRVGPAREHEHVCGREMRGQGAILQQSKELCVGKASLQRGLLRARADDHLRAGQVERQKCFDVLFHRKPPHRDKDRARKVEVDGAVRPEQVGIHASRPHSKVGESPLTQFGHERLGRDHRHGRGGMKSSQCRVDPRLGDRCTRRDVFGKARRVAGREAPALPLAIAAHHMTDGSLGCDMDRIGPRRFDALSDPAPAWQRQPQSRIGRYRKARKTFRGKEVNGHAETSRAVRQRRQGAHHAVHLWVPGVCCDQNPHQAALGRDG